MELGQIISNLVILFRNFVYQASDFIIQGLNINSPILQIFIIITIIGLTAFALMRNWKFIIGIIIVLLILGVAL